jgi:hypothetical protein
MRPMSETAPIAPSTPASMPVRPGRPKDDAPPHIPGEPLTFDDLIDFINPLHHLPVVGALYRALTGDEIKPALQIAGGTLFGGPSGFVSSAFQVLFEQMTGDDVLGTGLALVGLKEGGADAAAASAAPMPVEAAAAATDEAGASTNAAPVAGNAVVLSEAQDAYLRALAAQSGAP